MCGLCLAVGVSQLGQQDHARTAPCALYPACALPYRVPSPYRTIPYPGPDLLPCSPYRTSPYRTVPFLHLACTAPSHVPPCSPCSPFRTVPYHLHAACTLPPDCAYPPLLHMKPVPYQCMSCALSSLYPLLPFCSLLHRVLLPVPFPYPPLDPRDEARAEDVP